MNLHLHLCSLPFQNFLQDTWSARATLVCEYKGECEVPPRGACRACRYAKATKLGASKGLPIRVSGTRLNKGLAAGRGPEKSDAGRLLMAERGAKAIQQKSESKTALGKADPKTGSKSDSGKSDARGIPLNHRATFKDSQAAGKAGKKLTGEAGECMK
jgi:hypothetical protein